jgi:hypothetical protein
MEVVGGFTLSGGTVTSAPTMPGATSVTTDTLVQSGGDIVNRAAWTVTDRYTFSGGTLLNQGGGQVAVFTAHAVDHSGGTITSADTFHTDLAYTLSGTAAFTTLPASGPMRPVFSAQTFTQTGGSLAFQSTGGATNFNVADTFAFQGGTADIHEPLGYGTPGTIGQLAVTGTGLTVWGLVDVPGGVAVAANTMLQFRIATVTGNVSVYGDLEMEGGSIHGNLTNYGVYHFGRYGETLPFDYVTIDGNYTQMSSGTLVLDVWTGGGADGLTVSGTAQLAGCLSCPVAPGAELGPMYTLIGAGTVAGAFESWSLPGGYELWYDGGHVGIQAV